MILITGSNSLLGQKLTQQFLESGEKVRCLDLEKPRTVPPGAEFIAGDVLDDVLLRKACEGVTTVFHLLDIRDRKHFSRRYMKKVNVKGTEKVLFSARKAGVKKVFFLSSYEVYGKIKKFPIRQDDRKKPKTKFGKDKLKAENLCWEYVKKGEIAVTMFRPALMVGPGTDNPIILITLLMALGMEEANRMYMSGNGDNRFQLLHPDDAAAAVMLAYKNDVSSGKAYNLGSDNVPTQMEQIVKVKELAKLDCEIKRLSPGYTKFLSFILKPFKLNYLNKDHLPLLLNTMLMDCQNAKTDLGWEPTKDNIHIFLETIDWYKKEKL